MEPETLEWLDSRIVAYDLLRQLYLGPPTGEVLALVAGVELVSQPVPPVMREGVELMQGLSRDETVLRALAEEYTRLFVGPGQIPVPPFESCYRTGDGLVMQEVTTQVRRAYLDAGLLARRLHSDPVPSSPIVAARGADSRMVEAVRRALLGLEVPGKHQALVKPWDQELAYGLMETKDADYEGLRELVRRFGLVELREAGQGHRR